MVRSSLRRASSPVLRSAVACGLGDWKLRPVGRILSLTMRAGHQSDITLGDPTLTARLRFVSHAYEGAPLRLLMTESRLPLLSRTSSIPPASKCPTLARQPCFRAAGEKGAEEREQRCVGGAGVVAKAGFPGLLTLKRSWPARRCGRLKSTIVSRFGPVGLITITPCAAPFRCRGGLHSRGRCAQPLAICCSADNVWS